MPPWWPAVVLAVALAARLWGIGWQLPAALYFDEMKYVSWAGAAKYDASAAVTDLRNPTFFHHLLRAEYVVASLVQPGATVRQQAVFELWLARVTSAVAGSLACVLTALATSALVQAVGGLRPVGGSGEDRRDAASAGLAAGLVLALAPLHVHLSHYAVNDAMASLFLAATLWLGARALLSGRWADFALAGLMAGMAFSTKYSFGVGLVLPLAAAMLGYGALTPHRGRALPAAPPGSLPDLERAERESSSPLAVTASGPGECRGAVFRDSAGVLARRPRLMLAVLVGFALGAAGAAPALVLNPSAALAGIAEQARLGGIRWNGQPDAPVWQLYVETLGQGLGWPALVVATVGGLTLGWRGRRGRTALLAQAAVPAVCLLVMLRQELFFARFALPLLPSLATLAGIGVVALNRLAAGGLWTRSFGVRAVELAALAAALGAVLLPETVLTVRHNQLATTADTRVLARSWLRQRGDGVRASTELYGLPIVWPGNEPIRGVSLERVTSFVDASTVVREWCEGSRYFLVSSLTAERELARRGPGSRASGYDVLARRGQVVATFDPFLPGTSAPAHPDNTGIPFWYLERYARPGPKVTVYELPAGAFRCAR